MEFFYFQNKKLPSIFFIFSSDASQRGCFIFILLFYFFIRHDMIRYVSLKILDFPLTMRIIDENIME